MTGFPHFGNDFGEPKTQKHIIMCRPTIVNSTLQAKACQYNYFALQVRRPCYGFHTHTYDFANMSIHFNVSIFILL